MKRADAATHLRVAKTVVRELHPELTEVEQLDKAFRGDFKTSKSRRVAHAYVNHARWVADCPEDGCRGAELVTEDTPMLCGSCGTESRVKFPDDTAAIEAVLRVRPVENQSFWPGQTLEQLEAENIEQGLWGVN